jgi:alanine-glyoxylate transaminase/serine-glyoxylate transaminase/serine-pyruvate transaminase
MHPAVLETLSCPIRGIGDPELFEARKQVSRSLRPLLGTRNEKTFCIPSSGMGGMEAGFVNFCQPGERVVVCTNGFFGERMIELANRRGLDVTSVRAEWGTPFDRQAIRDALGNGPAPTMLAIVLAETSTGFHNDMSGLGDLAHEHGALLMVDVVAGVGGMPVDADTHGIDYAYGAAQKCVGSPPCLAMVTLSDEAWERLKSQKRCASFYLDLEMIGNYWLEMTTYHQTPSSPLIYSLLTALELIEAEGLEARFKRHREVSAELRSRLTDLGITVRVPAEHRMPMMTVAGLPDKVEAKSVVTRLRQEYKIEIGSSLGPTPANDVRIGTMGYAGRMENVEKLVLALSDIL